MKHEMKYNIGSRKRLIPLAAMLMVAVLSISAIGAVSFSDADADVSGSDTVTVSTLEELNSNIGSGNKTITFTGSISSELLTITNNSTVILQNSVNNLTGLTVAEGSTLTINAESRIAVTGDVVIQGTVNSDSSMKVGGADNYVYEPGLGIEGSLTLAATGKLYLSGVAVDPVTDDAPEVDVTGSVNNAGLIQLNDNGTFNFDITNDGGDVTGTFANSGTIDVKTSEWYAFSGYGPVGNTGTIRLGVVDDRMTINNEGTVEIDSGDRQSYPNIAMIGDSVNVTVKNFTGLLQIFDQALTVNINEYWEKHDDQSRANNNHLRYAEGGAYAKPVFCIDSSYNCSNEAYDPENPTDHLDYRVPEGSKYVSDGLLLTSNGGKLFAEGSISFVKGATVPEGYVPVITGEVDVPAGKTLTLGAGIALGGVEKSCAAGSLSIGSAGSKMTLGDGIGIQGDAVFSKVADRIVVDGTLKHGTNGAALKGVSVASASSVTVATDALSLTGSLDKRDAESLLTLTGKFVAQDLVLDIDTAVGQGSSLKIESGSLTNGQKLTINGTLTVGSGTTFTNDGTVENNGTFDNEGTVTNNGTIENNGTLSGDFTGISVMYSVSVTDGTGYDAGVSAANTESYANSCKVATGSSVYVFVKVSSDYSKSLKNVAVSGATAVSTDGLVKVFKVDSVSGKMALTVSGVAKNPDPKPEGTETYEPLGTDISESSVLSANTKLTGPIEIKSGATLTVSSILDLDGQKLTVNGNLVISAGGQIVSVSGKGSIEAALDSISNSGVISEGVSVKYVIPDVDIVLEESSDITVSKDGDTTVVESFSGTLMVNNGDVRIEEELQLDSTKKLSISEDANVEIKGNITGTGTSGDSFVNKGTLTIAADVTIDNVSLGGNVNVASGKTLTLGTVAVTGKIVIESAPGTGIMVTVKLSLGSAAASLGAEEASIVAPITYGGSACTVVYDGATYRNTSGVPEKHTTYRLNGIDIATVYTTQTVDIAVMTSELSGLGNVDTSSLTWSQTGNVGDYDVVTATAPYTKAKVDVRASEGVTVKIDGTEISGSTWLDAGDHTVTVEGAEDAVVKFNGNEVSGTFAVTSSMFGTGNILSVSVPSAEVIPPFVVDPNWDRPEPPIIVVPTPVQPVQPVEPTEDDGDDAAIVAVAAAAAAVVAIAAFVLIRRD